MTRMVMDNRSDRAVLDSARRKLYRQLTGAGLAPSDADALMAGKAIDVGYLSEQDGRKVVALMPVVRAFLKGQRHD